MVCGRKILGSPLDLVVINTRILCQLPIGGVDLTLEENVINNLEGQR